MERNRRNGAHANSAIDPDGRYSCDPSICAAIKQYLAKLNESRKNLTNKGDQRKLDKVLAYIGEEGESGPHYVSEALEGKSAAQTDQKGTTKIDPTKADSDGAGAGYIGHEAQHDLDTIARKHLAGAAGLSAVDEVRKTETNAYSTQALITRGLACCSLKNADEQTLSLQ